MLKKCLVAVFGSAVLSAPAFADADFDVIGQVTHVQATVLTIDRMGEPMSMLVTPITKIEVERRGLVDYDYRIPLSEIKVGEWVKAEVLPQGNNQFIAKEIEVVRGEP